MFLIMETSEYSLLREISILWTCVFAEHLFANVVWDYCGEIIYSVVLSDICSLFATIYSVMGFITVSIWYNVFSQSKYILYFKMIII